ncbi:MAG: hypothetical protein CMD46_03355 [Gammaproteobacteria bacterium]|nr:hypothetical protein [Gammaproteobacteria bacterium]|tara:strand:+ start:2525 stop:3058 length:534 start_codon:yes stop_codon:yes gene_type:complete
MSISKITKDLKGQNKKFPQVNDWNPELCEGQEFFINREGDWFYNDEPIKNSRLVNLFSTVLRKDDDNYFLVTPVEKVPVKVDIAPYKIIDFEIYDNKVTLATNLNYNFELNKKNTTRLIEYEKSLIPIVTVRDNIEGFFNRNTYYKLVDIAIENEYIKDNKLYIPSNNTNHLIGNIA